LFSFQLLYPNTPPFYSPNPRQSPPQRPYNPHLRPSNIENSSPAPVPDRTFQSDGTSSISHKTPPRGRTFRNTSSANSGCGSGRTESTEFNLVVGIAREGRDGEYSCRPTGGEGDSVVVRIVTPSGEQDIR